MANIHKDKEKLKKEIDRIKHGTKRVPKVNKEDRKLLLKFKDHCYTRDLSDRRVYFYLVRLRKITEWSKKHLKDMTKEDIEKLVAKINKKYDSEWTKHGYKTSLRRFFIWYDDNENSEKISWIKANPKKSKLKDPVVLSKEEILKLFKNAKGVFEKALVSFMYESGCRSPDELLNMKVGDVEFDEYGAMVKLTSGKVGQRKIRIVSSVPRLKEWLENHPEPKKNNWFWVNEDGKYKGERIKYRTLKKMVKSWTKNVGIDKRVTPYTFRRTRATHLANKWPTPVLYKYMGWVQGSDVIQRYVALSTDDVEETVLNFYGIKNKKKNGDIKPLVCSKCGKQNPPELEFCRYCNGALTEKAMAKVEEKKKEDIKSSLKETLLELLKNDPEVREVAIQKELKQIEDDKK